MNDAHVENFPRLIEKYRRVIKFVMKKKKINKKIKSKNNQ